MRRSNSGSLIVVAWNVCPNDGSAPFADDETMLVRNDTARFDRKRMLVFPISPVTVVGRR